ncbi:helix-turn-helix transcriptional regulator [Elusimicrobiota bacterium]
MEKKLFDVKTLSIYLSLPKATIYTWIHTGQIPLKSIVRFGRAVRFRKEEIDKWVNQKSLVSQGS